MFFFFNDTATTEIYTLSLHDALPILHVAVCPHGARGRELGGEQHRGPDDAMKTRDPLAHHVEIGRPQARSEEHTSELQSQSNLVCRLLLEKQKRGLARRRRLDPAKES